MIRSLFAAAVLGIWLSGGLHMADPRSLQCGQPARRYGDTAAQERMGETAEIGRASCRERVSA